MSQRLDPTGMYIHVSYNYTRNIRPLAPIFSPSGAPFTGISIKSRHLSPKNDQLALAAEDRPVGRLIVGSRVLHYRSRFSTHRYTRANVLSDLGGVRLKPAPLGSKRPTITAQMKPASSRATAVTATCERLRWCTVLRPNFRARRRSARAVCAVSASGIPARRARSVLLGA